MQVNGNRVLTYQDLCKGLDAKGNFVHRVINLATQSNEMLDDMTVIEANNGTALETTFRTETAKPVWTTYYQGVTASKGSKAKLKVTTGKMGTKLVIDKEMFDKAVLKGQAYADALLEDEIMDKKEGMRLEMGNTIIYGKLANEPRSFNGLFEHYTTYGADALNDDRKSEFYVLNAFGKAGGASAASENSLGSIALVGWSPESITAFHAENSTTGGITVSDKRITDVDDPDNGGTYEAYQQYLYWELGLAVRDFRCGGRICNIQRDDMLNKASGETAVDAAIRYIELIDRLACRVHEAGKQAWYMDRLMWEKITTLYTRVTRANAFEERQVDGGEKKRTLKGIPVRLQDCMKINEEKVAQA
ncbi:MAG: hypothetical protein MJZ81_07550 [Bacteroidales bacterium]|nr:hypothetical protein [Bacteroidales bacterium]